MDYSDNEKLYIFKVAFIVDGNEIELEISHKSGSLNNSKRVVEFCLQNATGFKIISVYVQKGDSYDPV